MNWIEKVRFLKEAKESKKYLGKYFIDIGPEDNLWRPGELEGILIEYPYVPGSYREFVKEFDNLGLGFVVFYGSEAGGIIVLKEEVEYWRDILKGEYFPFGKDADGSIFTFNKRGEVIYFSREDFDCKDPIKITDSFEEFIGECLLGKRYTEFETTENNSFYDFMKLQGWM